MSVRIRQYSGCEGGFYVKQSRPLWGRFVARSRWVAGPHPGVMLIAFLLLAGVLGAFAHEFLQSQADGRRQAEHTFAEQARLTSELTSSLFTLAASSGATAAAKAFGGPKPSGAELTATARRAHLAYAVVVDATGKVLAASAGAPQARVGAHLAWPDIGHALTGRPWLSDLRVPPGGAAPLIEEALPFRSPNGPRVEVEAFEATALFSFLRSYLKESTSGSGQIASIVDGAGLLIADSSGPRRIGVPVGGAIAGVAGASKGAAHRSTVGAPIAGSDWRVVLTEPTTVLYPALSGSLSWVVPGALAAFGLVELLALVLLRRMLVGTARVVEANRQLCDLNETLERRVAERTALAEQRAEELARSNSELEQFASVASHDLQEPLRKIRMYAERLPRRLGDELSTEAGSDLRRIHGAAERMQRLIDDLLSFARVTSKHRAFEPVDLTLLAHEVVGDLEARVRELGAEVEIGPLPLVLADRAQMGQLLQNLVSNALKFHREDVTPHVRIQATALESEPDRIALVTVEDNGIGFDPRYAEKIFSAFERLHTRAEFEGTGIGLSIARKIARRHGGELTATSTPGEGSSFMITLPQAAPARHLVGETA